MAKVTRKPIQFFSYKEMNLVLCDDGTVWKFEDQYVLDKESNQQKETTVWTRRPELETPGN